VINLEAAVKKPLRPTVLMLGLLAGVVLLSSCDWTGGDSKYSQHNNDAPTAKGNHDKADVGYMPDGFSNYATKCDRSGIRVYVLFHEDGAFGSISTIADPACK